MAIEMTALLHAWRWHTVKKRLHACMEMTHSDGEACGREQAGSCQRRETFTMHARWRGRHACGGRLSASPEAYIVPRDFCI